MNNIVTVEQALKVLKANGFEAQHVNDGNEHERIEFIHAAKFGVCIELPILANGARCVCESTQHPFESIEKLISWCETTILVETRAKAGDEFE